MKKKLTVTLSVLALTSGFQIAVSPSASATFANGSKSAI